MEAVRHVRHRTSDRWGAMNSRRTVRMSLAAIALALAAPGVGTASEPPLQKCDRLAASPGDGFGRGVPFGELDGERAVAACESAREAYPTSLRIMAHFGRALLKVGAVQEGARRAQARRRRRTCLGAEHARRHLLFRARRRSRLRPPRAGLFVKAAAQNNAVAENNLGVMNTYGHGLKPDMRRAVGWYRKAAERGHPDAQANLGNMYEAGQGVPPDMVEAAKWYRVSAEQGNPKGEVNMARMYDTGTGVEADGGRAYFWYVLAAGHSKGEILQVATEGLTRFRKQFDAATLKRLDAEIRRWKPR